MASDFFQQQDTARRHTTKLVVLFALAFASLVALIYGLLVVVFAYEGAQLTWWQPWAMVSAVFGVGSVVGVSSLYKVSQLASGGQSVALMMGCAEVPATTRDIRERRLLNVVEEMAIAAGVPVPPVYIIEEEGINAFAAGYAPGDAVVAVSRGCLNYLNRDELQGVVAHEFSHILNGDMRINIRLIAVIFGIMALSIIGRILLEAGSRGSSRSSKNDPRGVLILLGLGLFVLGLVGAFFGRLIQAAISRQREYLADASAVQFTRNPDGIGGALKKIGGLGAGSKIKKPEAEEIAHMFFASAFSNAMLATHPPLDDRIRRVDPNWDGVYPNVRPVNVEAAEKRGPRKNPLELPGMPNLPLPVPVILAEDAAERVGRLAPSEIQYARKLGDEFPEALREASEEAFSARALVYALLLDPQAEMRSLQLKLLQEGVPQQDFAETLRLSGLVQSLEDRLRLPLLDLAMPSLRQMSPRQHAGFREAVERLMGADQRLSLFEYTLRCVLHRHLDAQYHPPRAEPVRTALRPHDAALTVLALLAWYGEPDPADAATAFEAGVRSVQGRTVLVLPPRENSSLVEFDAALKSLRRADPDVKRKIVTACSACILANKKVTVREAELLRAICDTLDCPLPPLTVG